MRVRSFSLMAFSIAATVAVFAAAAASWVSPVSAAEPYAAASERPVASEPKLTWVLGVPASSALFASELGLSASELDAARDIGRRVEASQTAELAGSDRRIEAASASPVTAAEATTFNSAVDALQQQGIRDIAARLGKSESAVRAALATGWAQQVDTFNEAASYNRVAASLGVASYRVTATSFLGIDGCGVAVSDKYAKFAAKGWRSSIPSQYQSAYPASGRWAVGLSYGGKTVAAAPVVDVGPWNIDDNYWNSRFDPIRPRRLFKDVPQGTPEAAAAIFNGYNGGKDQFGRTVLNAAGIDLLYPTWADLGADVYAHKGWKDWVTVWFLWEPGTSLPPVAEGRLAGADRYATSIAVSKRGWSKASSVVLATGAGFPDALCAAPLADVYGGPVLLVDPDHGVTTALRAELTRLAPKKVFIVGGAGVVPSAVDAACGSLPSQPSVQRIAGVDRADTAARVARAIVASVGPVYRVVIATGADYPDALAAAPIAAVNHWPLLLVNRDSIPAPTASVLSELKPSTSLVVGGVGVVSAKVWGQLPLAYRVAGKDRFDTAARLGGYAETHGSNFGYVGVVNGLTYADALAAGPYVASRRGVLSLVQPKAVPDYTATLLKYKRGDIAATDAIGGAASISDSVMTTIHRLLRP